MSVHMKILSARFLKDAFKLETSAFGSLKELVYIHRSEIELKNVYVMGSEMQPQIMRARKSEQI
jgi:hypothetical protein